MRNLVQVQEKDEAKEEGGAHRVGYELGRDKTFALQI